MKWILYATALLFALLSCTDQTNGNAAVKDSVNSNATSPTVSSQSDSLNKKIDNTGTSMGEGTTTSGTSTGSSSSHKDSTK